MNAIRHFIRNEEGVTAVEYGMIAALVAVAIIAGAGALGAGLDGFFQRVADCMNTPTQAICTAIV